MKIKTKLTLGVGSLFLLILLLALFGIKQVNSLASDSKNILVANYNTLDYSRNMLKSLGALNEDSNQLDIFESNLIKQQNNITEVGEAEYTSNLVNHFSQLKKNPNDLLLPEKIRSDLYDIMKLNMDAIHRKSLIAEKTAKDATFWITLTGTLCFLIAFILLINLPGNIANPIKQLTESIKQIADKKYSQRVNFKSGSEFGELAQSFNTMAEKLEEFNDSNLAKLMREKSRIETLINNMQDPVIGLDENNKIIFANEEALKIAGLRSDQVIGKNSAELSVHNDLIRSLLQDITNKESLPADFERAPLKIFANNKESYFEKHILNISVTPTGEKEKELIGYVVILKNITSYKELDYAKTNFIATVSHELKTPIASIKMSLQLLENERVGKLNSEQINLVNSIGEDTARLLKITGELLNMTQVESGNIQLSIVPTDPMEIINYAFNTNRTIAEQKYIELKIESAGDLPLVLADREKTAWVLTNLISNAIRYSYEHSTIFLKLTSEGNKVIFAVQDSGQGIEEQYKDKIFDRYFRIPGTKKEGTGLGLSISKEFILAQGGRITVESEFGTGSKFSVWLNKA